MNKNLGFLLLAVYLIMVGITGLFSVNLGALHVVLPVLALISGILILMKR